MSVILTPEDLSSGSWTPTGATNIATDQIAAPDGTVTADRITDDGGGGLGTIAADQNVSGLSLSTQHAYRAFFKANGLDWGYMLVWNLTGQTVDQYFDLTNGVVGTPGADVDDSKILALPDNWWMTQVIFTTTTDANVTFRLGVAEADGDTAVDRDGTSNVYAWGATIEEGSEASPYTSEAGIVVPSQGLTFARDIARPLARNLARNLAG